MNEVEFNKVIFWVQIHDLGYKKFSMSNARKIGDRIGKCIEVESDEALRNRSYIRLKVEVEVDKPLMLRFWWTNSQGKEKWASIKYERLSDFCYGCGILGHTTQSCKEDVKQSETNPIAPAYGPWLIGLRPKPSSPRGKQGGKNVHHTPGPKVEMMREAEQFEKARKTNQGK